MKPDPHELIAVICLGCIGRDIVLIAAHLPGADDTEADEESRVDRSEIEWKFNPSILKKSNQNKVHIQDPVDLSANRVNFQLDRYVAWKPNPQAWRIYAFSFDWSQVCFYLFLARCAINTTETRYWL